MWFHLFVIQTPHRDELQQYLAENGVQTVIHYPIPPHKQPAYAQWNQQSLPVTEKIHQQVLSLPIDPTMTQQQVDIVIEVINQYHS